MGAHGYPKDEKFYARLCEHLGHARRGGRIDFSAIRDDGVAVIDPGHFRDEDHFRATVRALGQHYERDKLAGQSVYLEVWCEAAGMIRQLAGVARPYSITVFSCSGFDSLTAKHDIAARICRQGKRAVILHLGDYDPSGVSIFEAAAEDCAAFVAADRPHGLVSVEFLRVALTAEQVETYALPTTPPKASDGRSKRWEGETCQLEALPPDTIAALLDDAIVDQLDEDQLITDGDAERAERQHIAFLLPEPRDAATDRESD